MVSKKGILKTLEALVALFLVMVVLALFLPHEPVRQPLEAKGFLIILEQDDNFRSCVVSRNLTCVNQTIDANLEDSLEFVFNLSDNPSATVSGLPDVPIFSESLYIAGNVTNSAATVIKVFYWNKPNR